MFLPNASHTLTWQKKVALNLWLALSYVAAANIGLLFKSFNSSSTPIWPPGGLALAMALVFGFRHVIPGIILGSVMMSYQASWPLLTSVGSVIALLFEPIVATVFLQTINKGKFSFKRPCDITAFLIFAVVFSPFIANIINITFLYMGGVLPLSRVPVLWLEWFMGSGLGILIVTPFTLSFFHKSSKKYNIHEALILYIGLILASYWAFEGESFRKFILIPFITWAALRFSYRGVSLAAMIVGPIAIWRSTVLWGVFSASPDVDLLWIQFFIGGMAVVGYFMSTVMEADARVENKERELSLNLKHKEIAEEALAILDQALNNSPAGFALIDRDFKFLRINEALANINGIPGRFHLGRSVRDILPRSAQQIEEMVLTVLKTQDSVMNTPFSMPSPKNAMEIICGMISYYPVRHPTTNEIFAVGVSLHDLSEQVRTQKLLKENQDRLAFAQEAGQIGAFEWDLKSQDLIVCGQLCSIYEAKSSEFKNVEDWKKLIHPDDLEYVIRENTRIVKEGLDFNYQFRIITRSRSLKWVLARGRMIREGEGAKMIGINIDITEQKDIEQKLRLTEANLLHALSIRDEFMAIASHELKTPLTSLKLQNQLYQRTLEKDGAENFPITKFESLLDKNSRQIDRLTRLVDDMMDISRIRTGKLALKKETFELSLLVKDILARTREQFLASGSGEPIIESLENVTGVWDLLRIEQVITNVIMNAIRYGRGRPITLSLSSHGDQVEFKVTDQGLGIPKSDHLKIFQRYERGLLSREVSGLGLGLFISQQIVAAHGGKIWVESEINHGSTFYVTIPRSTLPVTLPNPFLELIPAES